MNTNKNSLDTQFVLSKLCVALLALGLVQIAHAEEAKDSDLTELTKPKSTVEAGVGGTTDSNWKFGQYNGLHKSGAFGIGNFDIRGGGAYDSNDATRWRVTGKNIGLETRSFTGEYKNQGQYKLNFGYDELIKNGNNSYQTPYNGVGGQFFTLPPNWSYPVTANNMRTLPAKDAALFQNANIGTKRSKFEGGFSYLFSPQWEVQGSFKHEDKTGLQTLGAPIVASRSVILPNPIDQTHDQINASLNYKGDQGFFQAAYYGSLFHNNIDSLTFQNAYGAPSAAQPLLGRMSTAPSNQLHQMNLSAGYNFTPTTKLVGTAAYGRNLQNQSFLPYDTTATGGGVLPTSSLNGDVEIKTFTLKLTDKSIKNLNLSLAYKFDERDNHTKINQYTFYDVDATSANAATPSIRSNTPFSKRLNQVNFDADYNLAKGHWLKAGYDLQATDRWCNGSWISCVDASSTTEHTGRVDYRYNAFDSLTGKLGYAYSHRQAENYNQDNAFWASFASPAARLLYGQISATGLTAWGPALGYTASVAQPFANNNPPPTTGPLGPQSPIDIAGLGRFNTANRDRQKVRTGLNYQVTDKIALGLGGDYQHDNYPNSQYGLKSSTLWGLNLDGSYAINADTSANVFYSYQDNSYQSNGSSYGNNSNTGSALAGSVVGGCYNNLLAVNQNAKIDPCRGWGTTMRDSINTVGLGIKHKGLFDGKLDLNGDFMLSWAKTTTDVTGGQYVASPVLPVTYFIPASAMPDVNTQTYQFKLGGKYAINKASAMHLTYMFQHLKTNDYSYTGMQSWGSPTGVMPTNEVSPSYNIHVVGLSYIYSF